MASHVSFSLDPTSVSHTFSYLHARDLCSASMVCREWQGNANDPFLWKDLLVSNPQLMISPHEPLYLTHPQSISISQVAGKGVFPPTRLHLPSNSPLRGKIVQHEDCDQGVVGGMLPPMAKGQLATYKQMYGISEAWRLGKSNATRIPLKGSDQASAVRIVPGGQYVVFASGGRGSCAVFDSQTGKRCIGLGVKGNEEADESEYEDLHGLYACSAISGDGETVGFGGFDGTVKIYDVTGGRLTGSLGGSRHRSAVQSLAVSYDGTIVAAGLSDGHLAIGHGRPLSKGTSLAHDWLHWKRLGTGFGVTSLEMNQSCRSGSLDQNSLVAGTSGGHVMVLDAATGGRKCDIVGSCSCPVSCLCVYTGDGPSGLVYAGFGHLNSGNGHSNAVFVWDVTSSERVALLYPRQTKGARGSGPVKSVFADGYKVVVTSGKAATVFETRKWEALYEISVSHRVTREEDVEAGEVGDEAETGGGGEDTDWFWNLSEGEAMGGSTLSATGIENCISPRPNSATLVTPHSMFRQRESSISSEPFKLAFGEGSSFSSSSSSLPRLEISSVSPTGETSVTTFGSPEQAGHSVSQRTPPPTPFAMNSTATVPSLGRSPRTPNSSKWIARTSSVPHKQSAVGSWSFGVENALTLNRKLLVRTSSDGDLQANLGRPSPRGSYEFEFQTDEPSVHSFHFLGNQLAIPLKGGAVGLIKFGGVVLNDDSVEVNVTPRGWKKPKNF